MTVDGVLDILGTASVVVGASFLLVAAVGVVRLPDVFTRQHAAGKAATLGVMASLVGTALIIGTVSSAIKLGVAVVFQFLASPVATHALARVAHRSGAQMWDRTVVDELAEAHASGDLNRIPEEDPSR